MDAAYNESVNKSIESINKAFDICTVIDNCIVYQFKKTNLPACKLTGACELSKSKFNGNRPLGYQRPPKRLRQISVDTYAIYLIPCI